MCGICGWLRPAGMELVHVIGMNERARSQGGTLTLHSELGQETTVVVKVSI